MQKLLIFTKFGGKVTYGPCQNPLDFNGNPDHVGVRVGFQLRLTFHVTPVRTVLR